MSQTEAKLKALLRDPELFTRKASKVKLRPYQLEVLLRIVDSILNDYGDTIVVLFCRQSGKNEDQAALETYLLVLHALYNRHIVKFSPTWKPQSQNAMRRLERYLTRNFITGPHWKKREGYRFYFEEASVIFYSAQPSAHVVSETADLLLEVDEAQDVEPAKYDKEIVPMVASTAATRVLWGTAWTNNTLLAREMRAALEAEKRDGRKRVFVVNADQVRKIVPAYGKVVDEQIARLGRNHPFVKTQYFCETIDEQAGMFPAGRRALMRGDRAAQNAPMPGHVYAFTLDVGGQDEITADAEGMSNPGRDYTRLDINEIDLSTLGILRAPTYRVVFRREWQGDNHLAIFGQLKSLIEIWRPQYIVVDATGVGEGLWSLLARAFPAKVIPFKFTQQSKSELGYGFLAVIETGRFRDCCPSAEVDQQYISCQSEILIGPAHIMRWGVPDGTRVDGKLVHDDAVIADALVAELDKLAWHLPSKTTIIEGKDPLEEMDSAY